MNRHREIVFLDNFHDELFKNPLENLSHIQSTFIQYMLRFTRYSSVYLLRDVVVVSRIVAVLELAISTFGND